jgi:hypothetical protein
MAPVFASLFVILTGTAVTLTGLFFLGLSGFAPSPDRELLVRLGGGVLVAGLPLLICGVWGLRLAIRFNRGQKLP